MPRLHFPRSSYDFSGCDFPYYFLDIIVNHGLATTKVFAVHMGIVRFLALVFVDLLSWNRTEIV